MDNKDKNPLLEFDKLEKMYAESLKRIGLDDDKAEQKNDSSQFNYVGFDGKPLMVENTGKRKRDPHKEVYSQDNEHVSRVVKDAMSAKKGAKLYTIVGSQAENGSSSNQPDVEKKVNRGVDAGAESDARASSDEIKRIANSAVRRGAEGAVRSKPSNPVQRSPRADMPRRNSQQISRNTDSPCRRQTGDNGGNQAVSRQSHVERMTDSTTAVRPRTTRKREVNVFAAEFQFLNCAICLLAVFAIFFILLFCTRESGYIESENRNLQEMPSLSLSSYFSGEYTSDVTTFFTDTIPGREGYKKVASAITSHLGPKGDVSVHGTIHSVEQEKLDEDVKASITQATIYTGDRESTTTTTENTDPNHTTTKESTKKIDDNMDEGAVYGNVIVSGSGAAVRAVSAFYGTFENTSYYAETINKYKEELGETINVYNMSIPISSAFYLPYNFKDQVTIQEDNIDNIAAGLKDIINVNVYNTLENHMDEYIYSRTDHHWQPLGAYYAASVFAQQACIDFPELDDYDKEVKTDFCGTMYMYSDYNHELADNPDSFTYYMPKNDYTVYYYDTYFQNKTEGPLFYDYASGVNTYSTILGGDELIAEIDTDVDNDRVLVMVKDSFGNALTPYFVNGFSKIYVVDFRYFNLNLIDFVHDVGCTDLLFAMSITSNATPSHIDTINNDRIQ